jgi:hypothetical protein
MASVVLIHAPDDTMPARALADKLRRAGLSVILEQTSGQQTREALSSASAVIALWSPRSAADEAIVEDVAFARASHAVVHASMQNANAPAAFSGEPTVNLTGWRGEDDFAAWRELGRLVTEAAGAPPLPPPSPRQAPGFFQPGPPEAVRPTADKPRASRDRTMHLAIDADGPVRIEEPRPRPAAIDRPPLEPEASGRGVTTLAIAAIAIAALGGGGIWFMTQSGAASSAAAWEQVDQANPDALRAFLAANPGSWRDEAEDALAALEERSYRVARDRDTIEAYQAFLDEFPASARFNLSARGRIAELRSAPTPTAEDASLLAPAEGAPLDPDLVPPNAIPETPAADGPVALNPPQQEAEAPPSGDGPVDLGAPPTN